MEIYTLKSKGSKRKWISTNPQITLSNKTNRELAQCPSLLDA
jgi:hypothetical protein